MLLCSRIPSNRYKISIMKKRKIGRTKAASTVMLPARKEAGNDALPVSVSRRGLLIL